MTPAAALTLTAASALLLLSRRDSVGAAEAGDGDYLAGFDATYLVDRGESLINQLTEAPADVDTNTASRNVAAFLGAIQFCEGTAGRGGYSACYGYSHTINDFSDHPTVTGEWPGVVLSDGMCANAGFGPGCKSTAAGAYQIIKPTWSNLKRALGLPDFSPASQDAAATELIRRRGALADVQAGRFNDAVRKCRNEWASLPGNYAGQGQRSMSTIVTWITEAGGTFA